MSSPARLRRVMAWVKFLSYFSIVPALLIFFLQQRAEQKAARLGHAMTFISMANSGDMFAVKERLTRPWLGTDLSRFFAKNPSPAMVAKLKGDVLAASPVSDSDVSQLADFYETVLICREAKVCEPDIVDRYFRRPISTFYCAYDLRLQELSRRLNDPGAFAGLAAYARGCRHL